MTSKGMPQWRQGETEYKFTLKEQIDRILQLFSQRLETSSANLAVAEDILVDTCQNAVDALEAALPFKDDKYTNEILAIGPRPSGAGPKEVNAWGLKKFGVIMQLMKRKRMLMEEVEDEVEEGVEEEDDDKPRGPGRPNKNEGREVPL